jgi:hypothetical protein
MARDVPNQIEKDLEKLARNRKASLAQALEQAIGQALHTDHLRAEVNKLKDEFPSLPALDPNFMDKDLYGEYGLPAWELDVR